MSIVFSRVDGRMIHGQVAIAWTRLLSIDEIIVISNSIYEDENQVTLLELACPPGIELKICTVDEFAELYEDDDFDGDKTMLIFKTLQDCLLSVLKGVELKSLNIGGMYFEEGKTKYEKALCLDSKDEEDIKTLHNKGIEIFYQVAPMNEKVSITKYLKI